MCVQLCSSKVGKLLIKEEGTCNDHGTMAYQDQDEDWERKLENCWRSDLMQLLDYYKNRIPDLEERRKVKSRFDNVEDFTVRVTWRLYKYAHPHGLWQLAISFAALASELPSSGPLDIGGVLSFLCKFEMALEMLRRKYFEYRERIDRLVDDDCALEDVISWLSLQKLPSDCVGEITAEIRALCEIDPLTGKAAYLSRDNGATAFYSALFRHIQAYFRHPHHTEWWLNSLNWFHRALMKEGEEVHKEAYKNNQRILQAQILQKEKSQKTPNPTKARAGPGHNSAQNQIVGDSGNRRPRSRRPSLRNIES